MQVITSVARINELMPDRGHGEKSYNGTLGHWTLAQCRNIIIFLSPRFYVKAIFRILGVQYLPFYHIYVEALKFEFYQSHNFSTPKIANNGSFRRATVSKIDF